MNHILQQTIQIARTAAKQIKDIYLSEEKDYHIKFKDDRSPVTIADKMSHDIIVNKLSQLTPEIPVLSEEGKCLPYEQRQAWPQHWLVDPLDGTKEFLYRSDEFTVNIALIKAGLPILGVVAVPIKDEVYFATLNGSPYWQQQDNEPETIRVQPLSGPIKIAISRRHGNQKKLQAMLKQLAIPYELIYCGSTLKICLVAKGVAHVYPRLGKTSEWDTAAGHCILQAAGGNIYSLPNQEPLTYNKSSLLNPEFVAIGGINLSQISAALACG